MAHAHDDHHLAPMGCALGYLGSIKLPIDKPIAFLKVNVIIISKERGRNRFARR